MTKSLKYAFQASLLSLSVSACSVAPPPQQTAEDTVTKGQAVAALTDSMQNYLKYLHSNLPSHSSTPAKPWLAANIQIDKATTKWVETRDNTAQGGVSVLAGPPVMPTLPTASVDLSTSIQKKNTTAEQQELAVPHFDAIVVYRPSQEMIAAWANPAAWQSDPIVSRLIAVRQEFIEANKGRPIYSCVGLASRPSSGSASSGGGSFTVDYGLTRITKEGGAITVVVVKPNIALNQTQTTGHTITIAYSNYGGFSTPPGASSAPAAPSNKQTKPRKSRPQ